MKKKLDKKELDKPVNVGMLIEYTESVLLPAIGIMITDSEKRMDKKMDLKLGTLKHELKEYIDKKLTDQMTEMFKRLDKRYEEENKFRAKVLEIFKRHKIGTSEDLAYLEAMVHTT